MINEYGIMIELLVIAAVCLVAGIRILRRDK